MSSGSRAVNLLYLQNKLNIVGHDKKSFRWFVGRKTLITQFVKYLVGLGFYLESDCLYLGRDILITGYLLSLKTNKKSEQN